MTQTEQQVFIIVREWLAHHAPPDFMDTPANGHALFGYILEFLGETVTIPNLGFAEAALRQAGKLQLAAPPPPPPPPTAEEVAAAAKKKAEDDAKNQIVEQEARWRAQHQAAINQKPRDFAGETRAHADAKAKAKAQADAEAAIKAEIAGYLCVRGNAVDHSRTNQTRADLAKVEVRVNGRRDAVKTLEKVREIMRNLP